MPNKGLCADKKGVTGANQKPVGTAHPTKLKEIVMRRVALLLLLTLISTNSHAGECKSLDVREFGLISDGSIDAPWSEAQLIEKYGPPCEVISLGEVFTKRSFGKIIESESKAKEQGRISSGEILEKKQFIYTGDYSNKTSIITIIGGIVEKKERIY